MNTSKLIFSAAITVVGIGTASAADLPVKAPPMPAPAAYDWTVFYVGGSLGGIWSNDSGLVNTGPTPALSIGAQI